MRTNNTFSLKKDLQSKASWFNLSLGGSIPDPERHFELQNGMLNPGGSSLGESVKSWRPEKRIANRVIGLFEVEREEWEKE